MPRSINSIEEDLHHLLENVGLDAHRSSGESVRPSNRLYLTGDKADKTPKYTHDQGYSDWIVRDKAEEFWISYCGYVNDLDTYDYMRLAEFAKDIIPVMSTFTMTYTETEIEQFNDEFIEQVVEVYRSVLNDLLQIRENSSLTCCVLTPMQRESTEGDLVTSQIKFQFPYCKTTLDVQINIIRPELIKRLKSNKPSIIGLLGTEPNERWEQIIDIPNKGPYPLYGSCIHDSGIRLVLSTVYVPTVDNVEVHERHNIDELSINYAGHSDVACGMMGTDPFDYNGNQHWLPMFLSVNYWSALTVPKHQRRRDRQEESLGDLSDTFILAQSLLKLVSKKRANDRFSWKDVGAALYHASNGAVAGLREWQLFTRKGDIFVDEDCEELYNESPGFTEISVTYKSIAWYAKLDHPKQYTKWHEDWCRPSLELAAANVTHVSIARAVYKMFWLDYACASPKPAHWYKYNKHKWAPSDGGLFMAVTDKFATAFLRLRTDYSRKAESNNEKDRLDANIAIENIGKLQRKLEDVPFVEKVIRAAAFIFHSHDENFFGRLNTNPDLMGLGNGVLECCENEIFFRPGKPEDGLTISSPLIWRDMDATDPYLQGLFAWLDRCCSDIPSRDWLLMFFASCIRSGNDDKILLQIYSRTNGSKSMLKKLVERAFGPYSQTMVNARITSRNKNSSGPTPDLAKAAFSKICWYQELRDKVMGEEIISSTGGDNYFTRFLNQNGGDFRQTNKTIFIQNNPVIFFNPEAALKTRNVLLRLVGHWSTTAPEDPAEQDRLKIYPLDPNFERKNIKHYAPVFMWVIKMVYPQYKTMGIERPAAIVKTTKEYWEKNDTYWIFIASRLRKVIIKDSATKENPEGDIDVTVWVDYEDVYQEYKNWHRKLMPSDPLPSFQVLEAQLAERLGTDLDVDRQWRGYATKSSLSGL